MGRGLESLLPPGPRMVPGAGAPAANAAAAPPAISPSTSPISSAAVPPQVPPTNGDEISAAIFEPTEIEDLTPVEGTSAVIPEMSAQAAKLAVIAEIALDRIDNNPYQTRGLFPKEELRELADSIKVLGVMQPIVVRPAKEGRFVLVAGERRCRASKIAGKTTIPAIIRQVSDQQAAEMTIIENLQRQDLNCMEQARAFSRLSKEFNLTQEQIGIRTGCSRETVSNYMRLLKLPIQVQLMMVHGQLDFSMGRVLLNLMNLELATKVADLAVRKHMSVVQLEDLVFDTNVPLQKQQEPASRARHVDPNVRAAQTELERKLGVRVRIRDRKGKGKIVIEYANLEDFDRVIEMLKGKG